MATHKSITSAAHRSAVKAVYVRMQQAIDAARGAIWDQYLVEVGAANPHGKVGTYIEKFDQAWERSAIPNSERPDMDTDGNYRGVVNG